MMSKVYVNLKKVATPGKTLFLFPFAGGTSQSYRSFFKTFEHLNCDIYSLELAGRGIRMQEPLVSNINQIMNECVEGFLPYIGRDSVFFGHSMGSILAYELLSAVESKFSQYSASLIVSAANSPRHIRLSKDVLGMNDVEFKLFLHGMGGIPPEISQHDALMQFLLPRIRNDFEIIDQYRCLGNHTLRSSIHAIAATDDTNLQHDSVEDWMAYTHSSFELTWCQGGHFYFERDSSLLTNVIKSNVIKSNVMGLRHAES